MSALEARRIAARGATRFPQQCTLGDLANADQIVALDEEEHRPLMRERFSDWEHRIQYWQVGDVGLVKPDRAFSLIEARVDGLLEVLAVLERRSE